MNKLLKKQKVLVGFLLMLLLFLPSLVFSQGKSVNGVVLDSQDMPLIGVSVLVKGTNNGVITDLDGKFQLESVESSDVLVFSYIGYQTQEIVVNDNTIFKIIMKEDVEMLDDVVVIGYGTAKKRDVVGAISKIKGDKIERLKSSSISQGLQGMAAGLNVTNSQGGIAGAGTNIQIRGVSSINLSSSPLWIIDGVPMFTNSNAIQENGVALANPLSMINPSDIKSIEVLKDAAATAIYGNRAAGGVIIVTTNQSMKEKTSSKVSYDFGISTLPISQDYFMNNKEWLSIYDMANKNSGLGQFDPASCNILFYTAPNISREEAEMINTDYMSHLVRTAKYHQVNANVNKAFETGSMLFSVGYRNEEGVLRDNNLKRLNTRFNSNFNLFKIVDLGASINAVYMKSQGVQNNSATKSGGGWTKLFQAPPFFKIYDDTDPSGYWLPGSGFNFAASHDPELVQSYADEYRVIGNAFINIKLPIDGLSIRGEAGIDADITNSSSWMSEILTTGVSTASAQSKTRSVVTWNGTMNYSKNINDIHSIGATIGGEAIKTSGYYIYGSGRDMGTQYPDLINPNPSFDITVNGGKSNNTSMAGFFARANYSYKSKYIINGSIRRDGHYALTKENRWATFAAGGLAWIISDEDFMNFSESWLSTLKLRTSYGSVGNTNMTPSMLEFSYNTTKKYWYNGIFGLDAGPTGSSDLKWEICKTFDLGIDFGFLNDRINGSLSYYNKTLDNLIMKVNVPFSAGLADKKNSIYKNVGSMYSRGLEFNVTSVNIIKPSGFKWTTDFNFTTNANKITKLDVTESEGAISGYTIRKEGYALGTYYLADYKGIDSKQGYYTISELDKTKEGYVTVDEGSTGKILPMSKNNVDKNRFILEGKTADPKWYGSLTNSFVYKDFDFSFMLSFSGGNWLYDDQLYRTTSGLQVAALRKDMLGNIWEKEGDDAKYAKVFQSGTLPVADDGGPGTSSFLDVAATSWFLSKGDYLKLKNIQLGYTIPESVTNKIKVKNIRCYVNASDLFTLTGFTGIDPESINGIPMPRTFSIGLSANF